MWRAITLDFRIRSEWDVVMPITADRPDQTRRSSDLSKHSAEVFAAAEDHPVTITRRDGEALVLMSQREAEGRAPSRICRTVNYRSHRRKWNAHRTHDENLSLDARLVHGGS